MFAIANSIILLFADAHKSADKKDIEFIRQFGTSDIDEALDVFADSSGDMYMVGFTASACLVKQVNGMWTHF